MRLSNSLVSFSRMEEAAARVKVTISILSKGTPSSARESILSTITVVFPLPAAALTKRLLPLKSIALCCICVHCMRLCLLFFNVRLRIILFQIQARTRPP